MATKHRKPKAASSEKWTWQLTQIECQKRGWHVERVDWMDRWGHSHDLLACFDALAWPEELTFQGVTLDHGCTYAIQFTSAPNRAARRRKVQACPILPLLKAAGWVPLVWAWRIKDGKPELAEDRV